MSQFRVYIVLSLVRKLEILDGGEGGASLLQAFAFCIETIADTTLLYFLLNRGVKVNGQHIKVRQHALIAVFTVDAGSAVFLRSVRVLPSHWHATRNFRS